MSTTTRADDPIRAWHVAVWLAAPFAGGLVALGTALYGFGIGIDFTMMEANLWGRGHRIEVPTAYLVVLAGLSAFSAWTTANACNHGLLRASLARWPRWLREFPCLGAVAVFLCLPWLVESWRP
jgi:hypothetical protein